MSKKLLPSVVALLLQFAAFALTLLGVLLFDAQFTPLSLAFFCGLIAMTLSHLARGEI